MARVLFVSDLHSPWMHRRALEHCKRTRDKFKCDTIIFLGDEADQASFSVKWAPNPDMPSPGDELEMAIEKLQPFYKEFPEATIIESNHGLRVFRKARVTGLPSAVLKRYQQILEYPEGWVYQEKAEIDGVLAIHGEGFNRTSFRTAHEKFKQSVGMGHIHSGASVVYSQSHKKRYFSANFGCLIDPRHKAFDYGKHLPEKPTIGLGVVIDGDEAYFVPMPSKHL